MKIPGLDVLDVAARLRRACEQAGSQQAWAAANGVSAAYVCDVLNARREPGEAILRGLGLRKVVRYVEVRSKGKAAA